MTSRRADLVQGLGLDLADPFTRQRETPSNLLERELAIETQPVSKAEHLPKASHVDIAKPIDISLQFSCSVVAAASVSPAMLEDSARSTDFR
jgi:hypothetical protein